MTDALDDLGDTGNVHAALRADVERVRRYGETQLDTWCGVRFDNTPTVRIVASFTTDLPRHGAALRALVSHPERLAFERRRHSAAELAGTRSEIDQALERRSGASGRSVWSSIGERIGVIHVSLYADQEHLASELAGRYGDAVEIEVGAFTYPARCRAHPPSPTARPEIVSLDGVQLRLQLEDRTVEQGHRGEASLVVANTSARHVGPLDSDQPLLAVLLDASGDTVGGLAPAVIAGTGLTIDLDPGERQTIQVLYGTASLREELGYLLPPGHYHLSVTLPIRHDHGASPGQALAAPPQPLTISPAPSTASA